MAERNLNLFETNKPVNAACLCGLRFRPYPSSPQMVLFRLRVAGRKKPMINDDAFEIVRKSQGVPREIIRLCALSTDRLLQSDESMISVEIANEVN